MFKTPTCLFLIALSVSPLAAAQQEEVGCNEDDEALLDVDDEAATDGPRPLSPADFDSGTLRSFAGSLRDQLSIDGIETLKDLRGKRMVLEDDITASVEYVASGQSGSVFAVRFQSPESNTGSIALKEVRRATLKAYEDEVRAAKAYEGASGFPEIFETWSVPNSDRTVTYYIAETKGYPTTKVSRSNPLTGEALLDYALDMTDIARTARERGYVLGDLKPANVVKSRTGGLMSIDSGANKVGERFEGAQTPSYAAIEFVNGKPVTDDLPSVAKSVWHMKHGVSPGDHVGYEGPIQLIYAMGTGRFLNALRKAATADGGHMDAFDELLLECMKPADERMTLEEFSTRVDALASAGFFA